MSDLTIKFDPTIPRGAHAELRAFFAPHAAMLREEIRDLRVRLRKGSGEDGAGEAQATSLTSTRYHVAHIALDASFFELTDVEKAQTIAHEAVHVIHDGYAREVEHLLTHFVPEDARTYVFNRLTDAEERVVETIAYALYKARGGD